MPPKKRASDATAARGRTKATHQDVDDERSESNSPPPQMPVRGRPPKHIETVSYDPNAPFLPSRGRPPKRFKKDTPAVDAVPSDHKSFIMKLFDRSVDLAKYSDNSALYPICRAWMANQPRSNTLINFKLKQPEVPEVRIPQTRIIEELKSGKITDINSMPACKKVCETTRFPENLQKDPKEDDINSFNLNYDLNNPPVSRDDLLAQMKTRSAAVRQNWQRHTRAYEEEKFGTSLRVLKYIYSNK